MNHTAPSTAIFRVAIIGAGPAGFYAADQLQRWVDPEAAVDLFDRLPTPFGLVRYGVAPDHEKTKHVTRVFERIADHPRFRFFGNVRFGEQLTLADLRRHYHAVIYATGAQSSRRLGIPGENLERVYSAADFVGWYNGEPQVRDLTFDLSPQRVAVVGVGDVALDLARVMCRDADELATTDITDNALAALGRGGIREVQVLGRRGPVQAAFTLPLLRELTSLPNVSARTIPEEMALDPLSEEQLRTEASPNSRQKVRLLEQMADGRAEPADGGRQIVLRFLVSPVSVLDDGAGGVGGLELAHNVLEQRNGRIAATPTHRRSILPVGAVFLAIGYEGVALPDVPFDASRGVIPNAGGRVLGEDNEPLTGQYVTGWIKRGPVGQIGTCKPCAAETVAHMLADARAGRHEHPAEPDPAAVDALVAQRQPMTFTYADWRRVDEWEQQQGRPLGRPRVKLTSVDQMWRVARDPDGGMNES